MQFLIFPTQIRIETRNSTYSFTSFRSRSNTLDHLSNLLLQSRQREADNIENLSTQNSKEILNKTIELSNNIELDNLNSFANTEDTSLKNSLDFVEGKNGDANQLTDLTQATNDYHATSTNNNHLKINVSLKENKSLVNKNSPSNYLSSQSNNFI